jgi:hypothetical protein
MKIVNRIVSCAALAVLVAAYFGCEKPEPPIVEPPVGPGRVEVYFFDDTLRIHPAPPYPDAPGFAIVIDDNGRVMRGEVVDLSVAPSHMGNIEFANTALGDTTNDQGRVEFYFRSNGIPGVVHVTGSVGEASGTDSLSVVISGQTIGSIWINISKPLLHVGRGHPDSTLITVCVKDSWEEGIPGVTIRLSVPSGRICPLPALTDSTGCARFWWWPDCCGFVCAYIEWGGVLDSACVTVDSL